jgi:hypothetical protein
MIQTFSLSEKGITPHNSYGFNLSFLIILVKSIAFLIHFENCIPIPNLRKHHFIQVFLFPQFQEEVILSYKFC